MGGIVSAKDVCFSYNDINIFNNLSFDVCKNTITSIIGSNNSGKTTLIKLLSGILPANGEIYINNLVMNKKNARKVLLNIGVILSNINRQFLFSSVIDELRFPLENLMFNFNDMNNRIEEVSSLIGIEDYLDCKIMELSDYQKLLILIAVSIIHKPKLLFIDDVFDGLNLLEKKELFTLFRKLIKEWDLTIIFTTSDLYLSMLSDNVIVIDSGKIAFYDSFDKIIEKDNELSKIGILVPLEMDLCLKLKFYNLIDGIYLNVDEVVDKLWP